MNHQLTVLPDETVAFYAYGSNGCDDIKERAPSGTVQDDRQLADRAAARPAMCHLNNIQYSQADDTLVFSDLTAQPGRQGEAVRRLDGLDPERARRRAYDHRRHLAGGEHGIHLLGLDALLIFNNNSGTGGATRGPIGSPARDAAGPHRQEGHQDLDRTRRGTPFQTNGHGRRPAAAERQHVIALLDARGVITRSTSTGTVLQTMTTGSGTNFGYIEKRATLYGPPPR